MSEYQLQQWFAVYLQSQGFTVYQEVPFLSRSIDIVAEKDDVILAYELKLNDWRKAVAQSSDHLHGVDRSYVCMPLKSKINEELIHLIQANGLGLVVFNIEAQTVEEIIPALDSGSVWQPARKWLTTGMEFAL
ncbi:hypothetical protein KY385_00435 [Candidatus Parcubacteria bacterium]|nr:hypothetical protein [Candidatus Parcubacteria bacterium]